jgi:hypothetical protein
MMFAWSTFIVTVSVSARAGIIPIMPTASTTEGHKPKYCLQRLIRIDIALSGSVRPLQLGLADFPSLKLTVNW